MKKTILVAFIIALLLPLGALAADKTPPSDGPVANFPQYSVGDQFVYYHTLRKLKEKTHEVVRVNRDGSYKFITYNEGVPGEKDEIIDRNLSNKSNLKKPVEYNYYLDFPIYAGKKWDDVFSAELMNYTNRADVPVHYKVLSYEKVETRAGTFDAFKIQFNFILDRTKHAKGTIWYSGRFI